MDSLSLSQDEVKVEPPGSPLSWGCDIVHSHSTLYQTRDAIVPEVTKEWHRTKSLKTSSKCAPLRANAALSNPPSGQCFRSRTERDFYTADFRFTLACAKKKYDASRSSARRCARLSVHTRQGTSARLEVIETIGRRRRASDHNRTESDADGERATF
ncbi:hypothetical protein CC80DRAFT_509457 [Byssothecium circinans]|uniref:Uncharacterized protein n=1 Tax=Byssothecium circinans TaxID=147558 RepID=A0A6A5TEC3_9PLEO|nr:hypothetical protein CC80DRAFT_509457 [Byssothecium circinans]